MIQYEHLCDTCALAENCPKAERYAEVNAICQRHLDEIEAEVKARPRDTKHLEYTLGLHCGGVVQECPYYQEEDAVHDASGFAEPAHIGYVSASYVGLDENVYYVLNVDGKTVIAKAQ